MKNIILFILLIILVIIYYKNYFSIKEDFETLDSTIKTMGKVKPAEKIDSDTIKENIPYYKHRIKDLWSKSDEKDEFESYWEEWEIYLSNNNDSNYDKPDTYSNMPPKGIKKDEGFWFWE